MHHIIYIYLNSVLSCLVDSRVGYLNFYGFASLPARLGCGSLHVGLGEGRRGCGSESRGPSAQSTYGQLTLGINGFRQHNFYRLLAKSIQIILDTAQCYNIHLVHTCCTSTARQAAAPSAKKRQRMGRPTWGWIQWLGSNYPCLLRATTLGCGERSIQLHAEGAAGQKKYSATRSMCMCRVLLSVPPFCS